MLLHGMRCKVLFTLFFTMACSKLLEGMHVAHYTTTFVGVSGVIYDGRIYIYLSLGKRSSIPFF